MQTVEDNENQFGTTDLPLAAWLYMNDRQLLAVRANGKRATFIFAITPEDEIITEYEKAKAIGNVLAFFNSYQALIQKARQAKELGYERYHEKR